MQESSHTLINNLASQPRSVFTHFLLQSHFHFQVPLSHLLSSRKLNTMPFTRALTASLFISFLLFHLSCASQMMGINEAPSPAPQAPIIDCGETCKGRCKMSSRPNLCKRACGSCCAKCKCVPPGTSGNYEACPCYFSLTTHDGHRKCP